ncbi:MAG TPA: hypothetical protein PKN75_00705 [Bacteroidia bacterium]|nr:hypothetical protein [Bacteroidia bacterium]HNU32092.1 hypothetical protein [Bacteroidia bacterium]
MSQLSKITLGVFTILPFLFFIMFIVKIFSLVMYAISNDGNVDEEAILLNQIAPMVIYIILFSFLSLALLIYYIIHLVNYKTAESTEKIVWVLLFIFFGIIVFPVYWYLRVWRVKEA